MRIAHLLPTTLIDYPGKVAALIYTPSCNFRCPFCHNPELVLPERIAALKLIGEEEVLSLLSERRGFLDALAITGGEPTLHHDLPRFIGEVKRLGYLVKLDTNGSHPDVLAGLFDAGLLDYVAMDVKAPQGRYPEFVGVPVDPAVIDRSIRLIKGRAPNYEFRTTVAPGITKDDILAIVDWIKGAKRYILQRFTVPEDKGLVDPDFTDRTALSAVELQAIWSDLSGSFQDGGVRP